jgi:hypothetical protein
VDDNLLEGEEGHIIETSDRMDSRFDCKGLIWITPMGKKEDYLGMEISQCHTHTYMSMCQYIWNCIEVICEVLGTTTDKFTPVSTPMDKPIDPDSAALDAKMAKFFMTVTGFLGWLQLTMRIDVCLLYSRAGQHLQSPNESALAAVIRGFRYLKGTINLCLAAPRFRPDRNVRNSQPSDNQDQMDFYTDSDHAGNAERQNKRRNQYGYVSGFREDETSITPVDWHSKVTSCAFAHPDIGESHADMSSAAGEVYAAGNAACEIMQLQYISEELNIQFPRPAKLQMDNTAAEAFTNNTVIRTKLKHIDVRQDWVRCLRDNNLLIPIHVPSADNMADFFTKILPAPTLTRLSLRDSMMKELPVHLKFVPNA